eukprot:jgi/Botrbrau1/21348/Bobra.0184s0057.1
MGFALNQMAEQEQIAFSCSLNGRDLPLQGGEMFMQDAGTATPHTTFETPLYREPSLYIPSRSINFEEIPIISLLTPAMQITESVPQPMQEDFAQVATNQRVGALQDFLYILHHIISTTETFFECIFSDRTYVHRVPDGLIDFDEISDLMRSCKVDSAILPFSLQLRNSTVFEGDPVQAPFLNACSHA